jgi:hypothetical protein
MEDEIRRDPGEGTSITMIDFFSIDPITSRRDPDWTKKYQTLRRSIDFGDLSGDNRFISLHNCGMIHEEKNCYVLCFSEEHVPRDHLKFGEFVVKVSMPFVVFWTLTTTIIERFPSLDIHCDWVTYGRRGVMYDEQPIQKAAFVKPPKFAPEKEARMIWIPPGVNANTDLDYLYVECPAISQFCTLFNHELQPI